MWKLAWRHGGYLQYNGQTRRKTPDFSAWNVACWGDHPTLPCVTRLWLVGVPQESSRQGWLGCVQWQRMTSTSLAFLSTGCIAPNSPVGGLLSRDFWAHTVCENMFQSFIEAALSSSNYMLSIATRTKHYPSSSSHWLAEGPLHWATRKAKWLQMVWQTAR